MSKLLLGGVNLSEYIWNDTHAHDWSIIKIDRAVCALDPNVETTHGGPGDWSGLHWSFIAQKNGEPSKNGIDKFVIGKDEFWQIALSYRGPLITALSWSSLERNIDQNTSPALVSMVKKLAQDLHLHYLDAHELMALEIPWDELQGNAADRLDYSETPTAFNLLFYEY